MPPRKKKRRHGDFKWIKKGSTGAKLKANTIDEDTAYRNLAWAILEQAMFDLEWNEHRQRKDKSQCCDATISQRTTRHIDKYCAACYLKSSEADAYLELFGYGSGDLASYVDYHTNGNVPLHIRHCYMMFPRCSRRTIRITKNGGKKRKGIKNDGL